MGLEVAAVAGIASLAATAGGTAMSFSEAAKAKKAQKQADADAAKLMAEARSRLDVNFADALSINKEPYDRMREAALSAGAQALEAGIESERGVAATAGRVLAQQQQVQGNIRDEMNKDLFDLESYKAQEDSRLRDINTNLTLEQVEGAQNMSAEMDNRANLHKIQGIEGALSVVKQGISMPALYGFGAGGDKTTPTNNSVTSNNGTLDNDWAIGGNDPSLTTSTDNSISSNMPSYNTNNPFEIQRPYTRAEVEQMIALGKLKASDVDWSKIRG